MLALALLLAMEPPPDWLEDLEDWDSPLEESSPADEPEDEEEGDEGQEDAPDGESEEEAEPQSKSKPKPLDESVVGAFRLLAGYLHFFEPTDSDDALVATVARVVAHQDLAEHVDLEVNVFADITRSPGAALAGTFATAGSFVTPYRAPQLTIHALHSGSVTAQMGIDRARLGFSHNRVAFDIGRFPVNYAVAQIFTPNDFFAPFSATAINRNYKPGVDAARLGFTLGKLSSLEVVGVLNPDWGKAALLARPSVVLWNFEWALLGGKLAERWVAGLSFQGDAGPIGLRGEGHVGFPDRDGDGLDDPDDIHVRLSVGPNINLNWRTTTLGAEYSYFSDGELDPMNYFAKFGRRYPDDLPYLGKHYVGLVGGLEATPVLRFTATGIVNAGDGSGLAGAFALVSVADEADLILGTFVPWGKRAVLGPAPALRSEFGASPLTLFLESRVYF